MLFKHSYINLYLKSSIHSTETHAGSPKPSFTLEHLIRFITLSQTSQSCLLFRVSRVIQSSSASLSKPPADWIDSDQYLTLAETVTPQPKLWHYFLIPAKTSPKYSNLLFLTPKVARLSSQKTHYAPRSSCNTFWIQIKQRHIYD